MIPYSGIDFLPSFIWNTSEWREIYKGLGLDLAHYYIHDFLLANANHQSPLYSRSKAQNLPFKEAVELPISKEKWIIGMFCTMNLPLHDFKSFKKNICTVIYNAAVSQYPSLIVAVSALTILVPNKCFTMFT